uniref:Uncharacterized protein n=1 Tax=Anopheles atroparvus TaxID=41427 RepID=A0A182ISX2_ANOAO
MKSTWCRLALATVLVMLVSPGAREISAQQVELDCSDPANVGIFLPHPSSCQKYLNCWAGLLVEGSCPLGLFFDLERQVCESEARVRCAETVKDPAVKDRTSDAQDQVLVGDPLSGPNPEPIHPEIWDDSFMSYEFGRPAPPDIYADRDHERLGDGMAADDRVIIGA